MLIFQIKRIISSEKWFNYVVTFFFDISKNLGRSDDSNRRKKRGWPSNNECKVLSVLGQTEQVVRKLNCGILSFTVREKPRSNLLSS